MTTTLVIKDLLYEELVMLQNIMWYTENCTDFPDNLDSTNKQIFEDLYNKVMTS